MHNRACCLLSPIDACSNFMARHKLFTRLDGAAVKESNPIVIWMRLRYPESNGIVERVNGVPRRVLMFFLRAI